MCDYKYCTREVIYAMKIAYYDIDGRYAVTPKNTFESIVSRTEIQRCILQHKVKDSNRIVNLVEHRICYFYIEKNNKEFNGNSSRYIFIVVQNY